MRNAIAVNINAYNYRTVLPAIRSANDYTARAIALCDGIAVPLETQANPMAVMRLRISSSAFKISY